MIACYDLKHCPPTYDIVAFLMLAEGERRRRGEGFIDLHIAPGPVGGFRGDGLWPYSIAERRDLLKNIAVPMCEMLPTANGVTVHQERPDFKGEYGFNEYRISLDNIVHGLATGGRCLRAGQSVQKEMDLVTITLREADHWPMRNSLVNQWLSAATQLKLSGFRVVIVRDTIRAHDLIPGFETDPKASTDLHARAKLYSSAFVNMGISNGPMWFALALDVPVIMLRPTTETTAGPFNSDFFRERGLPPGTQPPNAPRHQRLVWKEDTASDIVDAFNEMVPCLI